MDNYVDPTTVKHAQEMVRAAKKMSEATSNTPFLGPNVNNNGGLTAIKKQNKPRKTSSNQPNAISPPTYTALHQHKKKVSFKPQ